MAKKSNSRDRNMVYALLLIVLMVVVIFVGLVLLSRNNTETSDLQSDDQADQMEKDESFSFTQFPEAFGKWKGQWNNKTFGSSGSITGEFKVKGLGVDLIMDVNGFVFGLKDPAPIHISAEVVGLLPVINFPKGTIFGNITDQMFNTKTGEFSFTSSPNAEGINKFTVDGKIVLKKTQKISGTYIVIFQDGSKANGTFVLNKQ